MAQKVRTAVLLSAVVAAAAATSGGAAASEQRGYEMVTPAAKTASVLIPDYSPETRVPWDNGDVVYYLSNTPLPNSPTGSVNYYRADRGLAGWATQPLVAPIDVRTGDGWSSFGPPLDISASGDELLVNTRQKLDPADVNGDGGPVPGGAPDDLYLRHRDGTFSFVSPNAVDPTSVNTRALGQVLSGDGQHVVFEVMNPLLPADTARVGLAGVYDWHGGVLTLVATNSDGSLMSTGQIDFGDARLFSSPGLNPVSFDGSRIFFTIDGGRVYVRDHGVVRSIAPGSSPSGIQTFEGATPDGSLAFFRTDEALTPDDTDTSMDLYAFDVTSGDLTRISKGADAAGAGVTDEGVRVSDDGGIVYFAATGGLGGASPAPSGEANLYIWNHGTIHRIATVGDSELDKGPECAPPDKHDNWYSTGDGQHLVFRTAVAATSDDVDSAADIFEYTVSSGHIEHVSAGPAGGNSGADAILGLADADCPANTHATQPRTMSEDGRYVAFQTDEALVSRDSNGLRDVYVHDLADGTTQLVSSGTDSHTSDFQGMGPTGRDIYFATYARLIPQDADPFKDIYDARIGGGFAGPPAAPACAEDDCQGTAHGAAAEEGAPGSATLHATDGGDQSGGVPVVTRIVIVRPTSAALERAARTGRLTVRLRVNRAGTLRLLAKAVLHGRSRSTIGRGSVAVRRSGTVRVTLRLSAAARAALQRRGRLGVTLEASLPPGHSAKRLTITLKRAASSAIRPSAAN